jgi:hypothetical protein
VERKVERELPRNEFILKDSDHYINSIFMIISLKNLNIQSFFNHSQNTRPSSMVSRHFVTPLSLCCASRQTRRAYLNEVKERGEVGFRKREKVESNIYNILA